MVYVVQQRHEVNKSARGTRTLVPARYLLVPYSLSTIFSFLEALSSAVDMIEGHYDSRCGGPGCACCVGYRAPIDEFSSSSVYDPHIFEHIP